MECKICFEKYNEKERKPKIITSCGHTFCEYCLRKLTKCPTCVRQIAGTMTNYDTLDFTNNNISTSEGSKTKSEGPNRLSPERLNLKKEIEENKKKLSLKADEQLKKSYEIIQLIKATASREIERKKQILLKNHKKLVEDADRLEAKLNNDILSNQNDIESEIENIIAKLNEDLNLTEMNKIQKESILLKKIKSKIEILEKLELNYSLKTTDMDLQIGQIVQNNLPANNSASKSLFTTNVTPILFNTGTACANPFAFGSTPMTSASNRTNSAQPPKINHFDFNFANNNAPSTPILVVSNNNSQNIQQPQPASSQQSTFNFRPSNICLANVSNTPATFSNAPSSSTAASLNFLRNLNGSKTNTTSSTTPSFVSSSQINLSDLNQSNNNSSQAPVGTFSQVTTRSGVRNSVASFQRNEASATTSTTVQSSHLSRLQNGNQHTPSNNNAQSINFLDSANFIASLNETKEKSIQNCNTQ